MNLNKREVQSVLTISSIVSLRLLGIFLILPVFSIYTRDYPGATLTLSGLAFGIYALFQSLLQIPFGWASDRIGRKKVLITGLLLFSAGSIVCALAKNIDQLIFARALQGFGAVGSVAIAALGDLTRPAVRTQSFTITGIVIGSSFIFSLVAGPLLASVYGFKSLFYILAILGIIALLLTIFFFPHIESEKHEDTGIEFLPFFRDKEIEKLFLAAFTVSFLLNLFLFIYPLSLHLANVNIGNIWEIYLIIILPSAFFVYPYIRYSEKKGTLGLSTKLGFVFLLSAFIFYIFGQNIKTVLYICGMVYFLGHTIYQSVLPSFLTLRIPAKNRGISSGFYNLFSFFGASMGGIFAGMMYEYNKHLPLYVCIFLIIIWVLIGLPRPPDEELMN